MTADYLVQTSVAFLFNRPDTTARVFAEIAKERPKKLLVVADGPRPGHPGGSCDYNLTSDHNFTPAAHHGVFSPLLFGECH